MDGKSRCKTEGTGARMERLEDKDKSHFLTNIIKEKKR